jgi:hypothetical protein
MNNHMTAHIDEIKSYVRGWIGELFSDCRAIPSREVGVTSTTISTSRGPQTQLEQRFQDEHHTFNPSHQAYNDTNFNPISVGQPAGQSPTYPQPTAQETTDFNKFSEQDMSDEGILSGGGTSGDKFFFESFLELDQGYMDDNICPLLAPASLTSPEPNISQQFSHETESTMPVRCSSLLKQIHGGRSYGSTCEAVRDPFRDSGIDVRGPFLEDYNGVGEDLASPTRARHT